MAADRQGRHCWPTWTTDLWPYIHPEVHTPNTSHTYSFIFCCSRPQLFFKGAIYKLNWSLITFGVIRESILEHDLVLVKEGENERERGEQLAVAVLCGCQKNPILARSCWRDGSIRRNACCGPLCFKGLIARYNVTIWLWMWKKGFESRAA